MPRRPAGIVSHTIRADHLRDMQRLLFEVNKIEKYFAAVLLTTSNLPSTKREAWKDILCLGAKLGWCSSQPVRFRKLINDANFKRDALKTIKLYERSWFAETNIMDFLSQLQTALEEDLAQYREDGMREAQRVVKTLEKIKSPFRTQFPLDGAISVDTQEKLMQELSDELEVAETRVKNIRSAISSVCELGEICKFLEAYGNGV
jgi:hypothetical protein